MQIIGDIFNLLLLQPIINGLFFLVKSFEYFNLPGALGLGIIALTTIIRLVIWPFAATSMQSAKKMADLKPHLDKLKVKHGNDKQALAAAQMSLYKEHGINPAGGCLPALVQIALIWPLYQVILAFIEGDKGLEKINYFLYNQAWHIDRLPDPTFLGVNLAAYPSDFARSGAYLLLVPVITAVLQFMLSQMMAPVPVKEYPNDSPKEKKEKSDTEDAMAAVQSQMMFLMPLMIGYFSYTFPVGLALYWNVLNIVSLIQQYTITGWGALPNTLSKLNLKKS